MRFRWMPTGSNRSTFSIRWQPKHHFGRQHEQVETQASQARKNAFRLTRFAILNPRARNHRNFQEIVQSIANVGLKRPITVSPRKSESDSASYDLVCGQGRIEAFIQLGQTEIPAIVIEAEESDCLVMSLVENCARRQHRAIDLLQDIGTLRRPWLQRSRNRSENRCKQRLYPHDRHPSRKGRGTIGFRG